MTLAACAVAACPPLSSADESRADLRLCAPWLIGNTIFVLFIGHIWGFYQFHRFILPALPPLLWMYRRWYPRHALTWTLVSGVCLALALVGILRSDAPFVG